MPSSAEYLRQLQGIEGQIGNFNLATAPGEIRKALGTAVGNFQPQFQELAQAENKAYGIPAQVMQEYQTAQNRGDYSAPGIEGTQFTGVNPLSRLGVGLNRIGEQFGISDALAKGIDFQRGRLEQIAGDIGNQYQTGYQQLVDKYGRLFPLFQTAQSAEEARRARAAARGGGGPSLQDILNGITGGETGGGGGEETVAVNVPEQKGWFQQLTDKFSPQKIYEQISGRYGKQGQAQAGAKLALLGPLGIGAALATNVVPAINYFNTKNRGNPTLQQRITSGAIKTGPAYKR